MVQLLATLYIPCRTSDTLPLCRDRTPYFLQRYPNDAPPQETRVNGSDTWLPACRNTQLPLEAARIAALDIDQQFL